MVGLGTLATLASLALSAYGANESSKQNQKNQNLLSGRMKDLDSWYNKEYNTPITETESGQAALSKLREQMKTQIESNDQSAVRGGATAESKVATQSEMQKGYANAINNLMGYETQRKDNVNKQYQSMNNALLGTQMDLNTKQGESWSNFGSNVASTDWGALNNIKLGNDNWKLSDALSSFFNKSSYAGTYDVNNAIPKSTNYKPRGNF